LATDNHSTLIQKHKEKGSGGHKVGGAQCKDEEGNLWWRHHTQSTVIRPFHQVKEWDMRATVALLYAALGVMVRDFDRASFSANVSNCGYVYCLFSGNSARKSLSSSVQC